MGLLPREFAAKIKFFKDRQATWDSNKTSIGLSAADMTTMSGLISAADDGLTAQGDAQRAAKAATVTVHNAQTALVSFGMDLVKKIKAAAGVNPDVYALAEIDPPAPPSPVGELTKPTSFAVALAETGEITISWKATQPANATAVTYQVWRKLGAGDWICLGATGRKEFVDATMPAGTATATYKVQAQRSTSSSPWAQFVVNFGVSSGGAMTASVTEVNSPKIAA